MFLAPHMFLSRARACDRRFHPWIAGMDSVLELGGRAAGLEPQEEAPQAPAVPTPSRAGRPVRERARAPMHAPHIHVILV